MYVCMYMYIVKRHLELKMSDFKNNFITIL